MPTAPRQPVAPGWAYPRAALICALLLVALHQTLGAGSAPAAAVARLAPESARLRLDPNRATAAELALLPRIGPRLAENITRYRAACPTPPAFRGPADLDRVRGIGPATIAMINPYLEFPSPATSASESFSP